MSFFSLRAWRSAPIWLVGFRPFFALAMLAGAALPGVWLLWLFNLLPAPRELAVPALHWHAHEMLFGFGGAVLGGFLLTASKNWVGIRGHHGSVLIFLTASWLFERWALLHGAGWQPWFFWLTVETYPLALVACLLHTLFKHRANDSYRVDNTYFLLALPFLPVAKALLLTADGYAVGLAISLGLFRLFFILMLERTLTQFMAALFKINLPRRTWLDHGIKLALLLLALVPCVPALPVSFLGLLYVGTGALIALRTLLWSPYRACSRLDIGIMVLGMLALAGHLVLLGGIFLSSWQAGYGLAVHVFTVGTIGTIVPAMMIRIAKGHTGRKVTFDRIDQCVLVLTLLALVARIGPGLLATDLYPEGLWLAAGCWVLAFGILALRYIPFLLAPRVDGRIH